MMYMYGARDETSIAPSVFSTLPALPDVVPDMTSSAVPAPSGTSAPPPPPPSTTSAPPPPPPPSVAAPPPPPPPPAAAAPGKNHLY